MNILLDEVIALLIKKQDAALVAESRKSYN